MKRWLLLPGIWALVVALVLLLAVALGPPKHPKDPKAECIQKAMSLYELTKCDPVRANQAFQQSRKEMELESRIQTLENQERDRLWR